MVGMNLLRDRNRGTDIEKGLMDTAGKGGWRN